MRFLHSTYENWKHISCEILLYVFHLLSVRCVVPIILPVVSPYFFLPQAVDDCLKKYFVPTVLAK